ncbi:glyoxylase-like metal-dependent hydrolase (beta-lactamase superfamily II) [Aneurinibacillus soli]|uniref:Beta-lactamase n=1 Tax=Aneurinibacillus soli TaxID=1500254 RepID=A0A0U4WID6_9BACL|nr:MBL fold metallo-hydrolase [Aneurinibacillus soli]PYE61750.1 glyoxylase-like metal-dependent hydrolase (beta-lactamase superfamily II) [Aneurinibacillus soli]BAU28392.1 Beta-lactamase precursor [Aneurinibacillus soli]
MQKSRIIFFERKFPSANMILIQDQLPILIDTGFGSDAKDTEQLIKEVGTSPEELHLIVNTHYHSDHVGGNFHLQKNYGVMIAAHKWEADLINACDPEACSAEWLDQPVEPYRVDMSLSDNDEIITGSRTLKVLHTPGHTLGHISLYEPDEEILICGDLFYKNDIGWINIFREGVASLQRSIESLDRLSALPIKQAYAGHGPQMANPLAAIDAARERFEKWLRTPEKISWHACKRIFAYALIIKNGLAKEEINNYLLKCGWFQDFARYSFQLQPEEFVHILLDEMVRSRAARWHDNHLIATTPYQVPPKEWMNKNIKPKDWRT